MEDAIDVDGFSLFRFLLKYCNTILGAETTKRHLNGRGTKFELLFMGNVPWFTIQAQNVYPTGLCPQVVSIFPFMGTKCISGLYSQVLHLPKNYCEMNMVGISAMTTISHSFIRYLDDTTMNIIIRFSVTESHTSV